jgi:hypothetical protein
VLSGRCRDTQFVQGLLENVRKCFTVRHKAKQEAEEAIKLKLIEKDELIASMQRQVEELKRKSE